MPITDLLDRIPFSPTRDAAPDAPAPPERPFHVEALDGDGADHGFPLPPGPAPEAPADVPPGVAGVGAPPMPSWGIVLLGGLSLLCGVLAIALALALQPQATEAVAAPPVAETAAAPAPERAPATFSAEPTPIPVELITRLEAASEEPLDVELSRLLDAMQHGFGRRGAVLEPTLRSYVYRMASRFEWNPDAFRVAVTAPDPALATARGALLERLFEDAVAAGRLTVGTGVGPHALTLVAEPPATD
ncbi:hypothetical protein [Rubrivirga sp. IMCC45206]|uniref:hypothetical protein n=1 Tax=Rubrivirga sp. IMCC45206 TaxID=3391614 RepID=UPI00398FBC29